MCPFGLCGEGLIYCDVPTDDERTTIERDFIKTKGLQLCLQIIQDTSMSYGKKLHIFYSFSV